MGAAGGEETDLATTTTTAVPGKVSSVPTAGGDASRVIRTNHVPGQQKGHGQVAVPLVGPLLECVKPIRGIPPKFAMVQQIEGRVVVPVVLHNDIHPRKRPEIREGVRDVVLPLVR